MNPGRPLEILGLGLFSSPSLISWPCGAGTGRRASRWCCRRTVSWARASRLGHSNYPAAPPSGPSPGRWPRLKARLCRSLRRLRLAFYFSLLSAFNLGWRDLNVGNWISRLQKHEYTLRATGWPRTVAGLQSLLSVYLLALWVLTYFGRPFD